MTDHCEYCGVQGTLREDLELRPAPHVEGITVIACIDRHAWPTPSRFWSNCDS